MIRWMPVKRADVIEPWWLTLAPLTALIVVGLHNRLPSVVPSPLFGIALDTAFIVTGGVIAWRGRDRPMAGLLASSATLAVIGITVAGVLSLSPDRSQDGWVLFGIMANNGILAAGLAWLAIQVPRQLPIH
ncbi:hypothetical protein D3C72_1543760 [compost metagenome]